jgi:purine-binding chemotaxis protein CheW
MQHAEGGALSASCGQYCTFTLDGLLFGVEVVKVQEVFRHQEITAVPLAHCCVRGLMNLRGEIVATIDLRERLGLGPSPESRQPMNVLVRTEAGAVSLLVDAIGDVLEPDETEFVAPPDTLYPRLRELLRGVYKLEERLLLLLDTQKLLDIPDYSTE